MSKQTFEQAYEVIYIDKFTDAAAAELARHQLQQRFHMTDAVLAGMSSGRPVVIKRGIDRSEAERYERAIKDAGGTCWIQTMDADGRHHERRVIARRVHGDRRREVRGSSIQPDRRQNRGRRTGDARR